MASVPISQFEHRVARWTKELERSREPLEVSQHGVTKLVVFDRQTFEVWKAGQERLRALEIRLLVTAGEEAFRRGAFKSHAQVGAMLARPPRRKRRPTR